MRCPKCGSSMVYEAVPIRIKVLIAGGYDYIEKGKYYRYRCTNPDCKHIFSTKTRNGQRRLFNGKV